MLNSNTFSLSKKKSDLKNNQSLVQKAQDQVLNKTLTKSSVTQLNNNKQNKQRINFHPKELVFSLKNNEESQYIEIQNVTSTPIRLKLIKPQTKHFKIIYQNLSQQNYMLCPGLIKKIQVQYKKVQKNIGTTHDLNKPKQTIQLNQNYYDCIKIALQDKKYQIPIRAIKDIPSLSYEKLINLKFVDMNKLIKLHKKIVNNTNENVKVKLLKQSWQNMHIVPQELTLKANSQQNIQFSLTPTNIGAYHHKILVEAAGCPLDPIEIIYTTYDYNYCIVDANGAKINEVDFGYMYYGIKKTQTFYAVNNTPNTVQMKGKIRMGFKNNPLQSTFQSPQQFGQQCSSTLVQMYPKSLRISPFSKQKFSLTSLGRISQQHIGKVIKFSKQTLSNPIQTTHKRIIQTNQKCKIQDEQFRQSFISEFAIINNANLNKNDQKNKKRGNGKQQRSMHNSINMNTISNVVLTELKVYYGLPMVKILPCQFDFGKIILGKPSNQKFKISNFNVQLSTKIVFNKIIGVEIFPKQATLKPNQTKQFQIYVTPVNLGIINQVLKVIVEDNYTIDCRFRYQVIDNRWLFKLNSPKQKILHKSVHNDHSLGKSCEDKINFTATLDYLQKTCHNQIYNRANKISHSSSHMDFKIRRNNANSYSKNNIHSSSKNRLSRQGKNYMSNTDGFKGFMGSSSIRPTDPGSSIDLYDMDNNNGGTTKNKKKIDNSEIRHFEQQCQNTQVVRQLKMGLPTVKQNLFVTKKIDRFQPYTMTQNTRKLLKSKTSKQFFSNVIRRQPRNRRQAEQISMQLKGQSLKLIKINTKSINFGKMFVGSKMQKQFIVENQTQYSIQVRLKQGQIQNQLQKLENQMLNGTDYLQQIIPSHSAANFKICLFAKQCGKFQKAIVYTINRVHQFQFLVQAQIELAALTINKNILKMSYQDDVSQMFLKDTFSLRNDGNATTQFSISQINDHFNIVPSKGIVEPGCSLDVCLTYSCQQTVMNAGQTFSNALKSSVAQSFGNKPTTNTNFVDERISVDIKNGINMSIRVTFNPTITQPKCIVKQNKLNFGVAIVSKSKTKSFLIRNLSRTMTLFQIQNNECSQYLYFDILKGKLPPESSKQITATYKSSIIQQIDSFFKINIRGGLTINVPVQAQSVAPNIKLQQQMYNFGDVCCGAAQAMAVNVINQSQTVVELLLDLLDKRTHGSQYLYVSFVSQDNHTVFDQQTGNQKPGILKNKIQNNYLNGQAGFSNQDELIIDRACVQPQIHKLKIQPKSIYTFYIVFKPKLPGFYEFQLPLYLQNFIKNDSLNKVVTCFATQPKFIVQPSVIKFKKKIINQKQSTAFHPLIEFITLKNPGDKQLKWKIQYQTSSPNNALIASTNPYTNGSIKSFNSIMPSNSTDNVLSTFNNTNTNMINTSNGFAPIIGKSHNSQPDNKFCFQIQNKKGQVKPGSWECINIAFNPYQAGIYCYKLPLLIYNQQRGVYQQQAEIRLEGQGQYPTLFFDRKQVIMPVVPVGVESVAMFKVLNQGYETISLKHRIQIYDLQGNCIVQGSSYYQSNQHNSIPQINVMYPQGVKMGINKKQLYIIVKFTCKKAISFTCKLQLYDNARDCRVYSIPISGTCDNSILTIFPYLNDLQNKFKFLPSNPQATIMNYQQQKLKSRQLNNYLVNLQCTDDRNPIDKLHNPYEKITPQQLSFDCQIIRRWINGFLKDQKVGKYPEDVISNPENFLRMLYKITSKKQFETLISVINSEKQHNLNHTMQNNSQISQNNQLQGHINTPNQINGNSSFKPSSTYFNTANNNSNNIFSQFLSVPGHFNSKIQFYEYLIKLLKSMGCLLNHIRPYFLLSKDEFFSYMQKDPNWKNMAETYTKNYSVMHIQAWIILFYQIVSNFWYNSSKLKASLTNQSEKSHSNSLTSNVYSINQMTVLRWIKNIYQKYNELQDTFYKFMSYGDDFKDCVGLIYAIYHHIFNPSKKKKSLQGLTKKPTTQNQIISNTRILYQLIQKIGLIPLIYEQQYPHLKQKQMFLFMYQLYQMLPQQLPKTQPIYFTCNLGQKCTKFIQIKNSSNKIVHYWIKLQGSKDFTHEQKQSIKVQPKSTYKFKINFESRISQEEIAYLTFLNKLETDINNTTAPGTTLVFQLRSKIIGRKSIKKLQPIYCPIYETQTLRIPIQNQFQDCQFANFQIHLFQQLLQGPQSSNTKPKLYILKKAKHQQLTQTQQSILHTDKKSQKEQQQKLHLNKNLEDQIARKQDYCNFFVDNQNIKIKKNSTSYIELMFNPVIYQKIRCHLIFHDPLVGQFQYEIIGISQMPKILQQLKYPATIYTGTKQTLQVNLPVYNNYMIKANLLMEQKLYSKIGRQKGIKKIDPDSQSFKVQVNMDQKILQYVTFPQQFIIKNAKKQTNASDMISKLKIDCNFPVVIKDLALDFLLINSDKRDVRRIKLHVNLACKPVVSDLIIKTTARVPIIQPIPIQNTSIKDWRVKATLSQDQQSQKLGYLSLKQGQKLLSKDFIVKKNAPAQTGQVSTSSNLLMPNNSGLNNTNTHILTLAFSPKWTCKLSGKLLIQNITTNQQLIYHIKAICQQPISQGHLYFKIKTSSEQTKKITIKNPYNQSLTYKIQTDIQEMMKIPQYVYVQPNGEAIVNISLESLVPNKAIGYLKFTQDKGRFFWYTMTLESYDDSVAEKTIDLKCQVGEQISKTLQIQNPTNQKAKYQIIYPQNCFITGQTQIEVDPFKTYTAKFTFKPSQAVDKKVQVKIQNAKIKGALIYKLNLKATEQVKKTIQTLSAEVGKSISTVFKVTNNLKAPIKIKCQLSNNKYFQVVSNQIIAAKTDGQVKIQFKPLQQGKYPCMVKIYGEQFQTKCYEIQGIALQPFTIEKIQMKTNVGSNCLQIIKFKNPNPNKNKQKVQITLEDKEFTHNCFKLITDKGEVKKWDTTVSDIIGVPIQFNPAQNGYFQSMLYIQCSHYKWKYLLKGTTNVKTLTDVKQIIQGECKKQTIKIIKIPIPKYLKKQPNFSISMLDRIDLQCQDNKTTSKIKSWMNMKIQTQVQTQQKNSTIIEDQQITLFCKILPLQPIQQIITFNIYNSKSQGSIRLRHQAKLMIVPSQPQQTITIDVDSVKKYKFDINLQQIGVLSKKGNAVSCSMMKKQLVECKFKNPPPQSLTSHQNNNNGLNSSLKQLVTTNNKSLNNNIVQINFSPNNLTFNSNKGKNIYSDVLMIHTQKNFWSCQVQFKLNVSYNSRKQ